MNGKDLWRAVPFRAPEDADPEKLAEAAREAGAAVREFTLAVFRRPVTAEAVAKVVGPW